jgi:hypothetical protein
MQHRSTATHSQRRAEPAHVFTLVHGTFSPNAAWTQPGSKFRVSLEARYPGCIITAPTWSGTNTHAERLKASTMVERCLMDQHRQHPHAQHFVIAHSHGGTIALHACENESVRGSVSGVVTLGTPFIHTRRRDLRAPVRLFKEMVKLGRNLLMVWLWAITVLIIAFASAIYDVADEINRFPSYLGKVLTAVGVIAFVAIVAVSIRRRLRKSVLHAEIAGLLRKARAMQRKVYAFMREPYRSVRDVRILAISVDLDEARVLLKFLRSLGGVAHFVHDVISYSIRPAVFVSFALGIAVLIKRMYQFYAKTPDVLDFLLRSSYGIATFQLWALLWIGGLSVLLHVLMIVWPILRLHRLGYGEESFWPNWLLDIHVRKSPGFGPKWALLKVRTRVRIGRHSFFYNDPDVMRAIADWIDSPAGVPPAALTQTTGRRPAFESILVRVVSWILLVALAVWLWLDPIRIYHIHS